MTQIFYQSLIQLKSLEDRLRSQDLSGEEIRELLEIVRSSLHHQVITFLLSQLPQSSHTVFLLLLKSEPHNPNLWQWLEERIIGIKEKIAEKITIVEREFIEELKD